MTIIGLLLIIAGVFVGLTAEHAFNGQWLLGFIIAVAGLGLAWHNRKDK